MTFPKTSCFVPVLALILVGLCLPAPAQNEAVSAVSPEEVHALVAERAGKVVVVNFWATWCPPCLTEFPDVIRVYEDYRADGLEVLAVSMNAAEEIGDIEEFLGNFNPPFPVYRAVTQDETFFEGIVENWFGEMPTTLVFDTAGNLSQLHKKVLSYEELATEVAALLQ